MDGDRWQPMATPATKTPPTSFWTGKTVSTKESCAVAVLLALLLSMLPSNPHGVPLRWGTHSGKPEPPYSKEETQRTQLDMETMLTWDPSSNGQAKLATPSCDKIPLGAPSDRTNNNSWAGLAAGREDHCRRHHRRCQEPGARQIDSLLQPGNVYSCIRRTTVVLLQLHVGTCSLLIGLSQAETTSPHTLRRRSITSSSGKHRKSEFLWRQSGTQGVAQSTGTPVESTRQKRNPDVQAAAIRTHSAAGHSWTVWKVLCLGAS